MAVKGTFIDEGPLVVGMRSAVPAGGAVLCVGAVVGVGALRLRRRAMVAAVPPAGAVPGVGVPADRPNNG
ncbi:hypothetical protein ACFQ7B_23910 [Streptomyces erythrochromogenes]|uniref:hypothetical protein n=1 Tax=Streptomyces erythrochromogenes TaxID=285574 RepID=UPI00367A0E11